MYMYPNCQVRSCCPFAVYLSYCCFIAFRSHYSCNCSLVSVYVFVSVLETTGYDFVSNKVDGTVTYVSINLRVHSLQSPKYFVLQ